MNFIKGIYILCPFRHVSHLSHAFLLKGFTSYMSCLHLCFIKGIYILRVVFFMYCTAADEFRIFYPNAVEGTREDCRQTYRVTQVKLVEGDCQFYIVYICRCLVLNQPIQVDFLNA